MKNPIKLILISLLVIGGISAYFYFTSLKKTHQKELTTLNDQVSSIANIADSLKLLNSHQRLLINADQHFISGQYDQALDSYKSIGSIKNFVDSSLLAIRIQRIREIKTNKDTLFQDYRTLQYALNTVSSTNDSLSNAIDSLHLVYTTKLTNNEQEKEALEDLIATQQKKLQRKDKIQVITFKNQQGNTVHYLGEVQEDKANGGGIGIWDTGGIYKGEWKDNARHGKGTYTWKDGHRYEGDFVNDTREGQGTYYWSSGEKYEGQWKDGKRNGKGILYDKDNNVSYEGLWVDDKVAQK